MADGELAALVGLRVEQIWVWSQYVRLVFDIGPAGEPGVFVDVAEFRFTDAPNTTLDVRITDPLTVGPVLGLLNCRVTEARVRAWELAVDFDNGARIVCPPRRRFEAWAARPPGDAPWYCPPINTAPDDVVAVLRAVVVALAADDSGQAKALLDALPPGADHPDAATDSTVRYVATFLLDEWLSGRNPDIPAGPVGSLRLSTSGFGEPAAGYLVALARKGRAFGARHAVAANLGSRNTSYGIAVALAGVITSWAQRTATPIPELATTYIT